MLMAVLYNHGLFVTGVVVVGVSVLLSLLGLWAVRRLVPLDHRRSHNGVIGLMSATVGVIYAVLLAFIAISVWESFNKAEDIASREASLAGDLYRDAAALPPAPRKAIAEPLRQYVQIVVEQEWPLMARGEEPGQAGWRLLEQVGAQLRRAETASPVQVIVVQEMLSRLNLLYDARRERIGAAAGDSLHAAVWTVVLLGGLLTMSFCWLLGFEKGYLHVVGTGLVAACLGLAIFLIVGFDFPFRGKIQIDSQAFEQVQTNMQDNRKNLEGS